MTALSYLKAPLLVAQGTKEETKRDTFIKGEGTAWAFPLKFLCSDGSGTGVQILRFPPIYSFSGVFSARVSLLGPPAWCPFTLFWVRVPLLK